MFEIFDTLREFLSPHLSLVLLFVSLFAFAQRTTVRITLALGVSTLTYAVLILSLWASSTIGSPMSANNLMFSRQLGVPVWRLAWVWNMPAALLNFTTTVVLGLVMQQIARLG